MASGAGKIEERLGRYRSVLCCSSPGELQEGFVCGCIGARREIEGGVRKL
ncbi:hypothetical protein HPP92_002692 [Vanilla planifolia]|uniref:Uncharacterized protein n=1 Tax=Vanilla planifolia TaxID=51239 RepID=A0A835S901_VANPL|nr:hypothetical protein HPP92_002692 [Vanilla planifolia]